MSMGFKLSSEQRHRAARVMSETLNISAANAYKMVNGFHPMAEDAVVFVLNDEGVREWWQEERALLILKSKMYKKVSKRIAKAQARKRVGRLLQQVS